MEKQGVREDMTCLRSHCKSAKWLRFQVSEHSVQANSDFQVSALGGSMLLLLSRTEVGSQGLLMCWLMKSGNSEPVYVENSTWQCGVQPLQCLQHWAAENDGWKPGPGTGKSGFEFWSCHSQVLWPRTDKSFVPSRSLFLHLGSGVNTASLIRWLWTLRKLSESM